jgi:XTP/dITP diphosphohydrolase
VSKISFITSNPDKYSEMKAFFEENELELSWTRASLPELQADTLEEVVIHSLSQFNGDGVFVEDAGIFINALGGFPGVYSRYVYDTVGNKGILKLMQGVTDRSARFEAVVGFKPEGGKDIKLFKGVVKGFVSLSPKGEKGFGYDPIFTPEGFKKTFGEDESVKSMVSHRKRAAEKLLQYLKRNL